MEEPKQPEGEQRLVRNLDGFKAVMYMLFSIEAKLKVHTDMLIEFADILTNKDPETIKNETYVKMLKELKSVREKFVEDDELLAVINNIKL